MKTLKWKKVPYKPVQVLICLEPVSKSNLKECANLPIGEDHKFVAPNVWSIAEAQFWIGSKSCCIYHGGEMVGYILYNLSYNDAGNLQLWINRLMIAEPWRGNGYGRAVIQQCIAEAQQQDCVEVGLSTGSDNYKAIRLYESLGFRSTGELMGDETVYICSLTYPS